MPNVSANGIQIEYDTMGDPAAPPLLLIMGLGWQLIHWDVEFCKSLAAGGHYVIRYDNRDVGLSTKFEGAGIPNFSEIFKAITAARHFQPPYTLDDMAADAAGLLDALGIEKAHLCGISMGGMIAQILAIRHPRRVLSLTSIYSTTGDPQLPGPKPEAMEALMTPPPSERRAFMEFNVKTLRIIAGSGFDFDETYIRNISAASYDRCFYPQGVARQLAAVMAQENRTPALAKLTVPTLVIHGTDDPLVPMECGRATAGAVPGAKLLLIEGMGHDLPHGGAWLQIREEISKFTRRAKN